MKTRFNKIVVPTLAIAIGAAIVGSISGTVAWYQYSTRVSTAYLGTSAGTAGNLKLRIKDSGGEWLNSLTKEDIATYLQGEGVGQNIIPITAGAMGADDAIAMYNAAANPATDPADMKPLFYKNPIRGFDERVEYNSWIKADNSMFVQIPLEVAFIEYDGVKKGEEDKEYLEKDVYISDLLIQEDWQNNSDPENLKKDLSSAIRVHVSSRQLDKDDNIIAGSDEFDRLVSKNGGSILTEGYLDLDGDDRDDTFVDGDDGAKYGFGNSASIAANTKKVVYGDGVQTAYVAGKDIVEDSSYKNLDGDDVNEDIYPAVVKSVGNSMVLDENDFTFAGASGDVSKCIGKTIGYDKTDANWEQDYLNVTLTIWLEGWQLLPAPIPSDANRMSSIWNAADYIGSMFDVGIQFAVQAE